MKKQLKAVLKDDYSNIKLDNHNTDKNLSNVSNEMNDILKPAIKYINENFHEKITLDDLANICFITPGYFSKLFYRETGEKFSDYLTRIRIENAKKLLKTTDKTVQEISMEVGFNDAGYFSRRFKAFEGITPGNYRRILKNQSNKYKIIK